MEFTGPLQLKYNPEVGHFDFVMLHYTYPNTQEPQTILLEEGDVLTVRSPDDGSILITRVIEFDYSLYREMDPDSGNMYQKVNNIAVNGILKGLDGPLWVNYFIGNFPADLTKN